MITIAFDIKDLDYLDFKESFLRENPLPGDSFLTEDEWIKEWGRMQYLSAVERGKKRLAENVVVDPGIISCSFKS